jgi:hypothetical protein
MTVINTVMKKCIIVGDNKSIVFRDKEIVKIGLLGNSKLIRYGYILDKKKKEERFQRFWKWYREITKENNRSILNQIKFNTKELFVKLIHLEEEIDEPRHRWTIQKFQKSIEYNMIIKSRFGKPWISRELTDKIRDEFKRTYGFTEIIEKAVISDPEKENSEESENSKVSLNKNYMIWNMKWKDQKLRN